MAWLCDHSDSARIVRASREIGEDRVVIGGGRASDAILAR